MAKSFLDDLREHLEQVKNPALFLITFLGTFFAIALITLTGIYFYTRH